MKKEYIALIFISLLTMFYIKHKYHRKKLIIKKNDRKILVNDTEIEYSDLRYYINTRDEFEKRKTLYETILNPVVYTQTNIIRDIPADILDYHIDNQNVHDTIMQKNIKNTYEQSHNFTGDIEDITDNILELCKDKDKEKIKDIIEKIKTRNSYVTNVNSNEIDVLKNVWLNGDLNVKKQIINELLDCVDIGNTLYCPTGVTSRIISAAHINNPQYAPKTKDILKREVIEKFGHNYSKDNDKFLAKEKTINEYFSVYERKDIEDIINEWYDDID